MNDTLAETLDLVVINGPVSQDGLHLFALTNGPTTDEGVALLGTPLFVGSLRVEELDEVGSVPLFRTSNAASRRYVASASADR